MRRLLANLLLNLATKLGAKRVTVNVIKDSYTSSTADVVLTKADWDPDNAAALAAFLKTELGQDLTNRLRLVAATVAINGAAERVTTIHAAGISTGWNECIRYFLSLSRVSGVQDTQPNTEQAPQDEASLLELYSP